MSTKQSAQKKQETIVKLLFVLIIVIILVSIYFFLMYVEEKAQRLARDNAGQNITVNFNLIDHNENTVTHKDLHKSTVLVYFGFTSCPDVCPLSLNKIVQVKQKLESHKIFIRPVFITVDHERDTPQVLKEYVGSFDRDIIALTGSKEQIQEAADNFKIFFEKISNAENEKEYMMNHSTFVYLVGPRGQYMDHFNFNDDVEEIVSRIKNIRYIQNR